MDSIIEGNKLIAEFMFYKTYYSLHGGKEVKYYNIRHIPLNEDGEDWHNEHYLEFHSSWDWQLPVYKKMRTILQEFHKNNKHTVRKGDLIEVEYTLALMNIDIDECFKHLVQLIEWYNKEQKAKVSDTTTIK
jgi:hypothetical protein